MSNAGGSGGDVEEYERRMNEAMNAYMNREMERYMRRVEQQAIPRPPRVVHRRAMIDRDHVAAHLPPTCSGGVLECAGSCLCASLGH